MKKTILTLIALLMVSATFAQSEQANNVMKTLRLANDYFMAKYADPTIPTNVNRVRPSSLWTRAVYYEGLMALYEIDQDARYIDYTDRWGSFHQWTPRNGVKTNGIALRLVDLDRCHPDGHASLHADLQDHGRTQIC